MLNACARCQTVRNTSKPCHFQEFDTIARLETQSIDAYNDAHHYRPETQDGCSKYGCVWCVCVCVLPNLHVLYIFVFSVRNIQCTAIRYMTVHDNTLTWQYMKYMMIRWHDMHRMNLHHIMWDFWIKAQLQLGTCKTSKQLDHLQFDRPTKSICNFTYLNYIALSLKFLCTPDT